MSNRFPIINTPMHACKNSFLFFATASPKSRSTKRHMDIFEKHELRTTVTTAKVLYSEVLICCSLLR